MCKVGQSVAFCIWDDDRLLAKHQTQATIMALLFQRDSCSIPSALERIFPLIIALIFYWFFCPLKLSKRCVPFFLNETRINSLFVRPSCIPGWSPDQQRPFSYFWHSADACIHLCITRSEREDHTWLFLLALGSSLFSLWCPLATDSHCEGHGSLWAFRGTWWNHLHLKSRPNSSVSAEPMPWLVMSHHLWLLLIQI